jgi:hypothetical protein
MLYKCYSLFIGVQHIVYGKNTIKFTKGLIYTNTRWLQCECIQPMTYLVYALFVSVGLKGIHPLMISID